MLHIAREMVLNNVTLARIKLCSCQFCKLWSYELIEEAASFGHSSEVGLNSQEILISLDAGVYAGDVVVSVR